MLINVARCDYLTLTTFTKHDALLSSFSDLYPREQGKDAKIGGYKGKQYEGLFYGVGRQEEKAHFMLRASGEGAHTILYRTKDISVRCTRLDLQITIWRPTNYDSRKLYDILASPDIVWPGRRLKPSIIQSGDGLDTIYIGSRSSERFARIYVKPDHKGEPAFLRFEMEFKGDTARAARSAIHWGVGRERAILNNELHRLPVASSRALTAFMRVLIGDSMKIRPESVYGQNKTIDWIEKQVEPAILRLLHAHDTHDRMLDIINRWVNNST